MKHSDDEDCTALLLAWQNGDQTALERLTPLVYDELRRLARMQMQSWRAGHTLQPTALVNEAWLRLAKAEQMEWQNRAHFFAVAAQIMRRVLVDHARAQRAEKRGGATIRVALEEASAVALERAPEIIALDDALKSLAQAHPQLARIVEMRFFAGLENQEIGEVLGLTAGRASQLWTAAQAWLRREMGVMEPPKANQSA